MESYHFDGALMKVNRLSIIRSSSCNGSGGRASPAPALITSASLQSFSESDNDSLSSSPRPALSPTATCSNNIRVGSGRSIFDKYWTSPTHKKNLEKDADGEDEEVLKRLSTLQLPLADEDDDSNQKTCAIIHHPASTTVSPKTDKISPPTARSKERKTSFDDTSIKYSTPTRPHTQRRQILPTPPPPSVSSSLTIPMSRPQAQLLLSPRGWSSTSALLKRPSQSCLRKSRYSSFSGVVDTGVGEEENGSHDDELKKENRTSSRVSFYSQVSVFEYHEQIQRSQKGWSKYFA